MKYIYYDNCPAAIEAVGNGSYLYRWSIEEIGESTTDVTNNMWRCYEATVWNTPTKDKITEVVIDALWGAGVEMKLSNDYQAYQLGILDESFATPYIEFLEERKRLKEQITSDIEEWKSAT